MNEKSKNYACQITEESIKRGCSWAWFVFFAQIPFVYWFAKDKPALHPIVVMLPLVGLLNFKVEQKSLKGIGLQLVRPGRSFLLAFIYAALSTTSWLIGLHLQDNKLNLPSFTNEMAWSLIESILIGIFIVALWEEFVNRGYIQTRFQDAWGFWGVIIVSLLFAIMHIPSVLLDHDNNLLEAVLCFVETGLTGFAFGYVYWRVGSVITTILIHGLNNIATSLLFLFYGITHRQLFFDQTHIQLPWLIGQVGLTLLFCRILFKENDE
jgi:membrane protease YdiL (CAAX protease family)